MKKTIITGLFACLFGLNFAQDNLTVKMSAKVEGLPEEYAGMAENDIVTYLKGDKSKVEVTSMMGSNIVVNDGETSTTLVEQMGNKMGWVMTKAEMEEMEKEDKKADKPKIEYVNEKKMIAGYECSKAIVTSTSKKDKSEIKTIIWYTEKIKKPTTAKTKGRSMMNAPGMDEIKGFPMQTEMNMNQGGMEMKIITTVTEVSTEAIDDSVFKVDTEGYKMKTYKEVKEEMKHQGDDE